MFASSVVVPCRVCNPPKSSVSVLVLRVFPNKSFVLFKVPKNPFGSSNHAKPVGSWRPWVTTPSGAIVGRTWDFL